MGILTIILFLFCYNQIIAQWKKTSDEISLMTVMLYQQIDQSDNAKIGTGTIIEHEKRFYLLTAAHVAKDLKLNGKMFFKVGNDEKYSIDLILQSLTLNWKYHNEADIALIELHPSNKDIEKRFRDFSVSSDNIYDGNELIWKEVELTYFGFPVVDQNGQHFSPLVFASNHYASGLITQKLNYLDKKCSVFYLDKPSIQGASGSALYLAVKKNVEINTLDRTIMIGVVSGTFNDNTGGKLAIIMPSFYIWDLLKN